MKTQNGQVNGDVHAVEQAKTVNPHPGPMEPETKLTVNEFSVRREILGSKMGRN